MDLQLFAQFKSIFQKLLTQIIMKIIISQQQQEQEEDLVLLKLQVEDRSQVDRTQRIILRIIQVSVLRIKTINLQILLLQLLQVLLEQELEVSGMNEIPLRLLHLRLEVPNIRNNNAQDFQKSANNEQEEQ
jgi:hypothetical protein